VLVKDNRIVSTGYNGSTPGKQHCIDGGCPRGQLTYEQAPAFADYNLHPCVAVHAEANAIIRAGHAASKGGTLYVTCEPCQQCANMIAAAEIRETVVWLATSD
jgi:dCMP deaminase